MPNYVCYHLHTEDSLLDSCTNHKLYVDRAVELGQTAIGYSEHGNVYNWIEKKMYANAHGLKYLYECEVYLTEKLFFPKDDTHTEEYKVRDNYHTILIAKNFEGVKELNLLIDRSTDKDHKYYKPRITFDEFFAISDNIIKISACLASPLSRYPSSEHADRDLYERLLKAYDYYEVQPHFNENQIRYNKMLYEAHKRYGTPLIAGTDTHSLNEYKAQCRRILLKAKRIEYAEEDTFDLTYKSYDELVEMFKQQGALPTEVYLEAIENTNVMAASVTDFELDTAFKYPVLYDNEEEVFKKRINQMYKDKIKRGIIKPDPRYKQMVQEEMRVFKKIGMVGFMLFMSELVCWCWDNGIPVGYCRGSVGGSMIAYLTDIIDVNPLQWNTIFSRFANEDRKEIGDIDLDISPSQRHLVYEHIISEYGADRTAYVLAIGTISDKGTIDEIGRALDYPLDTVARIKKEFDIDPDGAKERYPDLFQYFDGLVNTAISQSMHPAGIIVSPVTLPDNYGTFWNDDKRILNINMEEIHEVSLVKYDLLGLKNIEVIKDCCELAHIPYPRSYTVNWEDQDVWEHIVDSPVGIFQFESPYAFKMLQKFKPHKVNDLSLINASLRPSGESYRDRLLNGEPNHNPSEIIDDLLKENNGYLVFQEDTIKFLQQICGLSGSEADNIRRAIGRKQKDRLEAALPRILEGYCSKSDKPRAEAEEEARAFLQIIEDSANYQFGFNHSTGYSMIGYMCAYLRYYHPREFITAYLNNANNDDDINMGTQLAEQLKIEIRPIKFRHSTAKYSCDDVAIYKGIESIKFLNAQVADELYELKDKQFSSFVDLLDVLANTSIDSRQLEILIKLNFFSEFGDVNTLLKINTMYVNVYNRKQFAKNKLEQLGVPEELCRKYCTKETAKTFTGVDTKALLEDMIKELDLGTSPLDLIRYEYECLGYVYTVDPSINKRAYLITAVEQKKTIVNATLYEIWTGFTRTVKMWSSQYSKEPFTEGQIIKLYAIDKKNKREPSDKFDENGKRIWIAVPDSYEYWIKQYEVVDTNK